MNNMEKLAYEIINFCKKWGMWRDVQILTGGKCYSACQNTPDKIKVREEKNPEEYTSGYRERANGEIEDVDYSNPEKILDMTFEGPLYLLLRHHEYSVEMEDLSDEARMYILRENEKKIEEEKKKEEEEEEIDYAEEMTEEYMERRYGWDPMEYDSYEEYLNLVEYEVPEDFFEKKQCPHDFGSRREYEDFIAKTVTEKEIALMEYYKDDSEEDIFIKKEDSRFFFDDGEIANHIINEFNDLLEEYGLWYELGFSWSLTTYRI